MPAEERLHKAQKELVVLSRNLDIQLRPSEPHEHKCIHQHYVVGLASSVFREDIDPCYRVHFSMKDQQILTNRHFITLQDSIPSLLLNMDTSSPSACSPHNRLMPSHWLQPIKLDSPPKLSPPSIPHAPTKRQIKS